MWHTRREAKNINYSPHLDGFMVSSSTLSLILLDFLNLTTSQNCDSVVTQKDMNDGQEPSCGSTQHSRCIGEGALLSSFCQAATHKQMPQTEHEFGRIYTPNSVPEFVQASVDLNRLLSQPLKYAEMSLDSDSVVPLKVDTKT